MTALASRTNRLRDLDVYLLARERYLAELPETLRPGPGTLVRGLPCGTEVIILMYIVACVFFIPESVLTLGAGAMFGVIKGAVFVSVGSTLGATATFLVGRYVVRDWVARKISKNAKDAKFIRSRNQTAIPFV